MNAQNSSWQKLVSAARQTPDERDAAIPYGFATRVVALAFAQERVPGMRAVFDRLSWRALGIAGLLAAVSFAASYSSLNTSSDDDLLVDEPAVAALFGVS